MAKKITAYCGFDQDSRSGYVRWSKEYLQMTDAQRLEFLTDVINHLVHEHKFRMTVIDNLRTASTGLGLPQ